ncbi:MAG: nitroreductase [Firmicutes bacterium]|nr:nitroreductase [Bacillota bacterium]
MPCGQSASTIDCSIALSYMTLEAVELGLVFCWLGWFDQHQVRRILHISEEYEVVAIAPIGYAAKDGRPSPKKSAEEVIVYNQMKV